MDARQFLAEFGHIASAPEGVQRLREMIYNLAIIGDLTQQFPEDGNAQTLLEKIEVARQRLIRAKQFKRTAKLESEPLSVPGNIKLPNSWRWTRLLDIGEISPRNEAIDAEIAAFIPMSGIPQSYKGNLVSESRNWGEVKKGFTHFANGDVVVAKITPCFENGKAAIIAGLDNPRGIGAGTTELHVFRPIHHEVLPAYVYIFLRSPFFAVEGERNMTGTAGQKRLPTEYFATRAMPLPPFAEQARIVAKVDELMALCDKLEAQQQELHTVRKLSRSAVLGAIGLSLSKDELHTAWQRFQHFSSLLLLDESDVQHLRDIVFHLGVTGALVANGQQPGTLSELKNERVESYRMDAEELARTGVRVPALPEFVDVDAEDAPTGWHSMTIESACTFIVDCPHSTPKFSSSGFFCIDTTCIEPRRVIWQKARTVSEDSYKERISRLRPRIGDLLFSREGTIGTAVMVADEIDLCLGQRMMLFRFAPFVLPEYAEIFLLSGYIKQQYEKFIKGTAAKHLNIGDIRKLVIVVPGLELQRKIVEIVNQLGKYCDSLSIQLNDKARIARSLSEAATAAITGIRPEEKEEPLKTPKTELVSKLRLANSPSAKEQAPLAAILARHHDEMAAGELWQRFGGDIDAFYAQLKLEIAKGWIAEPGVAEMREVEAG